MRFGIFEMRKFAKDSNNKHVQAMMQRIEVLMNKCARWNEALKELEVKNERLEQENSNLSFDIAYYRQELGVDE